MLFVKTATFVLLLIVDRLLLSGAPLVAIHKGRYYRKKDGLCLGPGAMPIRYKSVLKAYLVYFGSI